MYDARVYMYIHVHTYVCVSTHTEKFVQRVDPACSPSRFSLPSRSAACTTHVRICLYIYTYAGIQMYMATILVQEGISKRPGLRAMSTKKNALIA